MYYQTEYNENWVDDSFSVEDNKWFKTKSELNFNMYAIAIARRRYFYHRLDGPAFISGDKLRKEWFRRGIAHRMDGRAIDHPEGEEIYEDYTGYIICGEHYEEEEYWEMINLYKEDRIAFKLKYGFDIEQFFDFKYKDMVDTEMDEL